jgi:long-chain fatty acid transport protein
MKQVHGAAVGLIALLAIAIGSMPAVATDGYFSHGYGTRVKGMGGAGVALPQDSTAVIMNPAGALRVGNRYDISMALFHPERGYRVDGNPSGAPGTFGLMPGAHQSDNLNFGVPGLSINHTLGPRAAYAFTITGNGGMNTTYRTEPGYPGPFGAGEAGVNLSQLFIGPTYAAEVAPRTVVGISAFYAYQTFEARGVGSFASMVADGVPDALSNNGASSSTGLGWRVGVLHDVNESLTLGAAFEPQVHMSRFKGYADLFAEGGKFDIPASATLGLAYRPTPKSVVAFDYQHIWYRWIHSVGNPFANIYQGMGGDPGSLLGGDNGPGFGWRNMSVWKLGTQWDAGRGWTLRTGVNYARQPVPGSEVLFNILAPGVQEWHFTGGFTKDLGSAGELSLALMYSPDKQVRGANPMEAPGQQLITLHMHQFEVEMSWGKKF